MCIPQAALSRFGVSSTAAEQLATELDDVRYNYSTGADGTPNRNVDRRLTRLGSRNQPQFSVFLSGSLMMVPIGIRPTNDFAFKKTFGSPANKLALVSLLNAILGLPHAIVDVTLIAGTPTKLQPDFSRVSKCEGKKTQS